MGSRYNSRNEDYLKKLKDQYTNQLNQLKSIFNDWEDQDLLMTLEDVGGDLELAINRITDGFAQQWGKVERKHNKPKTPQTKDNENDRAQRNSSRGSNRGRGGGMAGRGGYSSRGRGRGGKGGMGRNQSNQGQNLNNKTSNSSIQNKRNHEKNANIDNTIVEENETSKSENKENKNENKQNNWKAKGAWSKGAPGSNTNHDQNKNHNNTPAAAATQNIPASESTNRSTKPSTAPEVEVKKTHPPKPKITYAQILKPTPKPTPKPSSPKKTQPKPKPVEEPKKEVEKKEEKVEQKPVELTPVEEKEKKEPVVEKTEETPKTEETSEVVPEKETPKQVTAEKVEVKKPVKTPTTPKTENTTNTPSTPKGKQPTNQNSIPPGFKQSRPMLSRKLKQEVAVVMPMNNNRHTHGVQFGSLKSNSIDIEEDKPEPKKEEATPQTTAQVSTSTPATTEVKPAAEPEKPQEHPPKPNKNAHVNHQQNTNNRHNNKNTNNAVPVANNVANTNSNNVSINNTNITPATTNTTTTTTASSIQSNVMASTPAHNVQKTEQPQVQQQQAYYNNAINNGTHNANNILNRYGYSQNQQIPGIQFNANHLGGVPDYSNIYNDPQLRGFMGYYDPTFTGTAQNPNYQNQNRDSKYQGQDISTTTVSQPSPHAVSQQMQQPQAYPNIPFYNYQFMPYGLSYNQSYPQSFQPFVQKNPYLYHPLNQPVSTTATTNQKTASQLGTNGFSYMNQNNQQHHMYHSQIDDMQNQEYMKNVYNNAQGTFQNFSLSNTSLQQTNSTSGQMQVGQKENSTSSNTNTQTPSNNYNKTQQYQVTTLSGTGNVTAPITTTQNSYYYNNHYNTNLQQNAGYQGGNMRGGYWNNGSS